MRAAVKSGATRKQAVAVANLNNILVGAAGGDNSSCGAVLPYVDIILCVEGYNALACCTRG